MNETIKPLGPVDGHVVGNDTKSEIRITCPDPIYVGQSAKFEFSIWVDIIEKGTARIVGSLKDQSILSVCRGKEEELRGFIRRWISIDRNIGSHAGYYRSATRIRTDLRGKTTSGR